MITRLVFLALLTLLAIQPSVTNAQGTIMGYCTSNVVSPSSTSARSLIRKFRLK